MCLLAKNSVLELLMRMTLISPLKSESMIPPPIIVPSWPYFNLFTSLAVANSLPVKPSSSTFLVNSVGRSASEKAMSVIPKAKPPLPTRVARLVAPATVPLELERLVRFDDKTFLRFLTVRLEDNVKDLEALKEAAEARLTKRQETVAAMKQDKVRR